MARVPERGHQRLAAGDGAPVRRRSSGLASRAARVGQACAAAAAFCRARGRSLAEVALQFALTDPPADTTLVGMRTTEEVQLNVAAAAAPPDLEFIATLQKRFAPVRNLTWPSGRPENN